ncbi:M61 family metallopeptidase [uncultured Sphingomonas sp.]|uniref:M61 family metallopeptidase n=1 Tax=uncultured Sphingomonas sp. TaxID=158754 RepID=UPI0035CA35BD
MMAAAARAVLLVGAAVVAAPVVAQQAPLPMAAPFADTIPAAQDTAWPGTLTLDVDASNAAQDIISVRETIPVSGPGPLVLLYPEWLPGEHGPTGPIALAAGFTFTAGGKPLAWRRDSVDVYAFHLDVPAGASSVEARFQFLPPHERTGSPRVVTTPTMANIEWNAVSLYPAGHYVRRVPVKASVTWPAGWTGYTALRGTRSGDHTVYETVPYDVLVDSPIFAGRYARQVQLDPAVTLDIVGDTPDEILPSPQVVAAHKALVVQADRLFGARHYDHYDLLVATSDVQSDEGLEHHRSSENSFGGDLFTDWDSNLGDHYVVAHEFTHSWNGKYRRPFDLWTPDYRTPMRDSLLWVYEGQTQFWGNILAARSGLWTKDQYLDNLAGVAALYTGGEPGMAWRPLQDTTNDPIIAPAGGSDWASWSRSYDYYRNGELIWLEADAQLRSLTGGAKGMDDFAKRFFGVEPGVWDREHTYTFDDVVATLNAIAPHDWAGFLRRRLDATGPASLAGIEQGGYRLVFTTVPNAMRNSALQKFKEADFTYSIGIRADEKGSVISVLWQSAAFLAGVKPGDVIVAVADHSYRAPVLSAAIKATAGNGRMPITLSIRSGDQFRTVSIAYRGGLRYPHLERIAGTEASLDRLIAPR